MSAAVAHDPVSLLQVIVLSANLKLCEIFRSRLTQGIWFQDFPIKVRAQLLLCAASASLCVVSKLDVAVGRGFDCHV